MSEGVWPEGPTSLRMLVDACGQVVGHHCRFGWA